MDFSNRITDIAAGKAFIDGLQAAGLMFHFEDSADQIGNMVDGEWVRCFTDAEAVQLRSRVDELYSLDWATVGHECPIGYALEIMGHVIE